MRRHHWPPALPGAQGLAGDAAVVGRRTARSAVGVPASAGATAAAGACRMRASVPRGDGRGVQVACRRSSGACRRRRTCGASGSSMRTEMRGRAGAPSSAGERGGAKSVTARGTERCWPLGRGIIRVGVLPRVVEEEARENVCPERGCAGSIMVT
jgi:hypothetical protein